MFVAAAAGLVLAALVLASRVTTQALRDAEKPSPDKNPALALALSLSRSTIDA